MADVTQHFTDNLEARLRKAIKSTGPISLHVVSVVDGMVTIELTVNVTVHHRIQMPIGSTAHLNFDQQDADEIEMLKLGTGYTRGGIDLTGDNVIDATGWEAPPPMTYAEALEMFGEAGARDYMLRQTIAHNQEPPGQSHDLSTQPPVANGQSFTLPTDDES